MEVKTKTAIKQITEEDHRFYEVMEGVYYPSVTTVLSGGLPTSKNLIVWFKSNGFMSDHIAQKAAREGTIVHNAIEDMLNGSELEIDDFDPKLWEMICKFAFFFHEYVEEIYDVELRGITHEFRMAGTVDLRCKMKDGRVMIIDFKTSNYVHEEYSVQTYAYTVMARERNEPVDGRGVLWLKAKTRGKDKKGKKIQGKGWQLIEHEDDEHDHKMLSLARETYDMIYPNVKPNIKMFPNSLSIGTVVREEDYKFEINHDTED